MSITLRILMKRRRPRRPTAEWEVIPRTECPGGFASLGNSVIRIWPKTMKSILLVLVREQISLKVTFLSSWPKIIEADLTKPHWLLTSGQASPQQQLSTQAPNGQNGTCLIFQQTREVIKLKNGKHSEKNIWSRIHISLGA